MNLDYWLEEVKATTAIAASLAVPIASESPEFYLPMTLKTLQPKVSDRSKARSSDDRYDRGLRQ
jgi:hypothetical protein